MATPSFLGGYNLLVDMKCDRLFNAITSMAVQSIRSQVSSLSPTLLSRKLNNAFEELLTEFPAVTELCNTEQPVRHNITHHITNSSLRISSWANRLTPEWFKIAHQEFDHMMQHGIIRPSSINLLEIRTALKGDLQ